MSAWRDDIERIREALESPGSYPKNGPLFAEAAGDLDALTAQMEELERERDVWCDQELRLNAAYSEIAEMRALVEVALTLGFEAKGAWQNRARAALAQSDPPED